MAITENERVNDLTDGYLLVLLRDEAKTFFGHREDQARLGFLNELLSSPNANQVNCERKWQVLHDAFSAVQIDDSILDQCLLGGRRLHQGDNYHVRLVRPDVVRAVADQCAKVRSSNFGDNWELAQKVSGLFQAAAEVGGATVFVAKV